jgi:hypothetical protein
VVVEIVSDGLESRIKGYVPYTPNIHPVSWLGFMHNLGSPIVVAVGVSQVERDGECLDAACLVQVQVGCGG